MRIKWIAVAVILAISLGLNIWFAATLRLFRYNLEHGLFTTSEAPIDYPIIGISSIDFNQILEQIDATKQEFAEDKYILSITVIGYDKLIITTGRQDGMLSGRGRIFRFYKTISGWKIDKERTTSWVS